MSREVVIDLAHQAGFVYFSVAVYSRSRTTLEYEHEPSLFNLSLVLPCRRRLLI